ncbi:hypothetical protein THTE_0670 [Thermogutta terrifontis]|uniref:Uncharacterized protein n=1 Tax=Thermogutta terrifontis TaxID=1331910 RepID=A0A286RBD5_9BACT|nr:hypothetical protein THTE_0670 [Thermogutta terrifontis]
MCSNRVRPRARLGSTTSRVYGGRVDHGGRSRAASLMCSLAVRRDTASHEHENMATAVYENTLCVF